MYIAYIYIFENITELFKNIAHIFDNIAHIFENIAHIFENIAEIFEKFADIFENIAEMLQKSWKICSSCHQPLSPLWSILKQQRSHSGDAAMLVKGIGND